MPGAARAAETVCKRHFDLTPMHELAVCQSLIAEVRRVASERNANDVTRIVVRIGPLSGVEPDLLANAYPIAAAGTPAADAELEIRFSGVRIRCRVCDAEADVAPNRLLCPSCGDLRTELVSGDELILESVELAEERRVNS